jgi:hypothetical protein
MPTVWRPDLNTFVYVDEECDLSTDGWCKVHSTGDGPAYCEPAENHPWPAPRD